VGGGGGLCWLHTRTQRNSELARVICPSPLYNSDCLSFYLFWTGFPTYRISNFVFLFLYIFSDLALNGLNSFCTVKGLRINHYRKWVSTLIALTASIAESDKATVRQFVCLSHERTNAPAAWYWYCRLLHDDTVHHTRGADAASVRFSLLSEGRQFSWSPQNSVSDKMVTASPGVCCWLHGVIWCIHRDAVTISLLINYIYASNSIHINVLYSRVSRRRCTSLLLEVMLTSSITWLRSEQLLMRRMPYTSLSLSLYLSTLFSLLLPLLSK